jgi:hypothetical protein
VIYYLSTREHTYTPAVVLLYHRRDLLTYFRFVTYDNMHSLYDAGPGVTVWTDLDRLSGSQISMAATTYHDLMASRNDIYHLNQPGRSLTRYKLLRRLFDAGINRFNVYRIYESMDKIRFPVFIRPESGALHASPALIDDYQTLQSAIDRMTQLHANAEDLIIIEFGARPDNDGYYRKYGAFRIDNEIYPQHCFTEQDWFIKFPIEGIHPDHRTRHYAYMAENPHARELMEIFELARINYGRIDYCLVNGEIQVFEINTNPMILANPPTPFDSFDPKPYAEQYADALSTLPGADVIAHTSAIDEAHEHILSMLRRTFHRKHFKRFRRQLWRKVLQLAPDWRQY